MKNKLFKLYILSFLVLSDFAIFAQPGDNQDGGGLEGNDDPPVPINGKLIWLAIAGLLFVAYSYNKKRKTT